MPKKGPSLFYGGTPVILFPWQKRPIRNLQSVYSLEVLLYQSFSLSIKSNRSFSKILNLRKLLQLKSVIFLFHEKFTILSSFIKKKLFELFGKCLALQRRLLRAISIKSPSIEKNLFKFFFENRFPSKL